MTAGQIPFFYRIHDGICIFDLRYLGFYKFDYLMYFSVRDKGSLYTDRLAHSERIEQHVSLPHQLFRTGHI